MSNLYKCDVCGKMVSQVEDGSGVLMCCSEPMKNLNAINGNEGIEKHKPVITKTENGIKVEVGSVHHPMGEDHRITLIQVYDGEKILAQRHLSPTDTPVAEFDIPFSDSINAKAYCDLHGFWQNK